MSGTALLWLTLLGLLLAAWGGTGSYVLRNFSHRQLEIYCRAKRRRELFDRIVDQHDDVAVSADLVGLSGIALAAVSGTAWLGPAADLQAPSTFAGVVILLLLSLIALTIWLPQSITRFLAAPFLYRTWSIWVWTGRTLLPLHMVGDLVKGVVRRLADQPDVEPDDEEAFEDEIRSMVSAGERDGLLEPDAREMIEGVIELGDADVSDIMTPRSKVDAFSVELSWPEVLQFANKVGRTRIPVYERSLDDIVGILYVKDLLAELARSPEHAPRPLTELLRETWFVPQTMPVDALLHEFLQNRNHIAIVLDEYRSVAGVVTIEDALEEIVGEIVDESEQEDEDIVEVDEVTAEVVGQAHLGEVNERLGLNLPEPDDFDTIGGLVMHRMGAIPKDGDSIVTGNVRITVLKANRRRVDRVRLETLPVPPSEAHVE